MRVKLLVGAIATAVALSGCSEGATGGTSGETAQYRGDLQNTGVYETAGLPALAGQLWNVKLNNNVHSSPILADGLLYVGDEGGQFYAVSAEDGSVQWQFEAKAAVRSSATVYGGEVYFTDTNANLYALDAATGQQKWTVELDDRFVNSGLTDAWDYYGPSPAIDGDTIYIGSEGFSFYALERKNGAVKWTHKTGANIHSKPVVTEDAVYYGDKLGNVVRLDKRTGEPVWSAKRGVMTAGAAFRDNVLYFGSRDQFVYALDAITGEQLWAHQTLNSSWVSSSPAVSEQFVAIGASDAKVVHVFDRKAGAHSFDFALNSRVFASPIIAGDILYFGSAYTDSGNGIDALYAVDLKTGGQLWKFEGTKKAILGAPVVSDGVVYYVSMDGQFYALH